MDLTVSGFDQLGIRNGQQCAKDIIERILSEEERQILFEQLRDEKFRFEAILDQLPSGIFIAQVPSGKIIAANHEAERILGHPVIQSETYQDYSAYGGLHAEGTPFQAHEYPTARAVTHGEVVNNEEIRYLRPDGKIINLIVNAAPIRDLDGIVRCAVCVFYDDTRGKVLEEELKRSNSELSRFAAVAAHDLKAPLNTVTQFLEIISDELGQSTSPTVRDSMRRIHSAGNRMRALIDDLLQYAKFSSDQSQKYEQVDLESVLTEVRDTLDATLNANHARLVMSKLPLVHGNRHALTRVFQNLISNSLKFRRGENPVIEVTSSVQDGQTVITVQDNGLGFSMDDAQRIFEPFHRGEQSAGTEGAGLGLSICRAIIEKHGGQIWATSAPHIGTRISFSLMRSDH